MTIKVGSYSIGNNKQWDVERGRRPLLHIHKNSVDGNGDICNKRVFLCYFGGRKK